MKMLPGVGVFGTGNAVRVVVPCLRARGFRVEALWGRTYDSAKLLAKELDIQFFTCKVDDVLLRKDVELVCIVCPPHLHAQIAVKALGIGKHVICDRPAGLGQAEVLRMVHAAQYYPSLISVLCHTLRFLPAFVQMKKHIQEDRIGDLTLCECRVHCGSLLQEPYDWCCDDYMGGGLLSNFGSHIIDILAYVTGLRAKRVHGVLRTYTRNTENINGIRRITSDDFCTFQMEMERGICATVTLNSHLPGQFSQEVLICGTKGNVIVRDGDLYGQKNGSYKEEVLYLDVEDLKSHSPVLNCIPQLTMTGFGLPSDIPGNNRLFPKPYLKGLVKMVAALKEAFQSLEERRNWIKEPVQIAATFEDGQYIQAVVDAIRESSKTREWVPVKLLTEEPESSPFLSNLFRRSTYSL